MFKLIRWHGIKMALFRSDLKTEEKTCHNNNGEMWSKKGWPSTGRGYPDSTDIGLLSSRPQLAYLTPLLARLDSRLSFMESQGFKKRRTIKKEKKSSKKTVFKVRLLCTSSVAWIKVLLLGKTFARVLKCVKMATGLLRHFFVYISGVLIYNSD